MEYEYINVQKIGGVLVITMDDPPTRNAIGEEMASEVNQELDGFEADPDLRAVVLTGSDPSFCSGANVKRMDQSNQERETEETIPQDLTPWEWLEHKWQNESDNSASDNRLLDSVRFVPLRIHNLQKPSIAAVNGYAMGLGMGIAYEIDLSLAIVLRKCKKGLTLDATT